MSTRKKGGSGRRKTPSCRVCAPSPKAKRTKATGSGTTGRQLTQKVKSAKGRKLSSTLWLQRQLNDPYVAEARKRGYRSRAAFKLLELDEKFHLLKPGIRTVDLGAAPGGWTQVAVERVKGAPVVAMDIQEMEPVSGATVLLGDFMEPDAPDRLKAALDGPADLVLSDMSPPTTGHSATDHLRIIALVETALMFAEEVLSPGGAFVAKVFQGGTEHELLHHMKRLFATVKHAKPPSSRKESAEAYVIAQGFRGRGSD